MPCNTTVIGRGPTARDANTTTPGASAVADKSTLALAPKPSPLTTATRASSAPEPLATTSKQTAALAQNQRARDRSIASLLGRSRTKKRHASQRAFTPVVNSLRNAASETHRASEEKCDHRPLDHGKRAPLNLLARLLRAEGETIPISQILFELEPQCRATRPFPFRKSRSNSNHNVEPRERSGLESRMRRASPASLRRAGLRPSAIPSQQTMNRLNLSVIVSG